MPEKLPILRIAVIGPESTGKSTLCKGLAEHFNTLFAPEFARDYMANLHRKYTESDVLHCIAEQINLETSLIKNANNYFFSDTENIMAKVWMEDVYNYCPDWIEKAIQQKPYDLYLLCNTDLPFENDPVRENPLRREFFFRWYESELKKRKLPYAIIKGSGPDRLANAINIIHNFFDNTSGRHNEPIHQNQ